MHNNSTLFTCLRTMDQQFLTIEFSSNILIYFLQGWVSRSSRHSISYPGDFYSILAPSRPECLPHSLLFSFLPPLFSSTVLASS